MIHANTKSWFSVRGWKNWTFQLLFLYICIETFYRPLINVSHLYQRIYRPTKCYLILSSYIFASFFHLFWVDLLMIDNINIWELSWYLWYNVHFFSFARCTQWLQNWTYYRVINIYNFDTFTLYYWFKYDLDRGTMHLKFNPTWVWTSRS